MANPEQRPKLPQRGTVRKPAPKALPNSNSSQLREPFQGRSGTSQMREAIPGKGILPTREMPGAESGAESARQPSREVPVLPAQPSPRPQSGPVAPSPRPQSGPVAPPRQPPARQPAPAQPAKRKAPETLDQVVRLVVRQALKHPVGMTIHDFDEKFMPLMRDLIPDALKGAGDNLFLDQFVAIAHGLYITVVCGHFKNRPVLAAVRAAELAADLVERAQAGYEGVEDARLDLIRCRNLLAGLTLQAVRLLETASLEGEALRGFTDSFERAVITVYGLKTQAEATGQAPWAGMKDNPLDKRIGMAINAMSNTFGDFIGKGASGKTEADNQAVLAEFDGFMERFAPYIEGGRASAMERARKLNKSVTGFDARPQKIEPLEIAELKSRPAGVEVKLADGRVLFISTEDARAIGASADGESVDSRRIARDALSLRKGAVASEVEDDEDAQLMAEIQRQAERIKRQQTAKGSGVPAGTVKLPPRPGKGVSAD